ncbi:MAG: sulfite exporter TauE/SafE family protein [Acidimicrobiales bacterium]
MSPDPILVMVLAAAAATLGTLGGLGGAVLLVPVLVATGTDPLVAAPIGLVTVGAGALAAAPNQLAHGLVHHRLGLTVEIPASTAALVAAWWSVHAPDTALRILLASVVFAASVAGLTRAPARNVPQPEFVAEPPAEWPGTLGGTYQSPGGPVPYRARRLPAGLIAMVGAGAISGLAGVGGGFVKTPVMREIMWIPIKVAAATSTFAVSITTATALVVFAGQGRIEPGPSVAAGIGGLAGGLVGARLQDQMSPTGLRRVLSVVLMVVAVVVLVGP